MLTLEQNRLDTLKSCQILDTPASREFDDITKLASIICETPIALISLVDEHRQWFKSKIGLNSTETDRNVSFCSIAIREKKPFIIPNATLDPRFNQNPLVVESPHIRLYVGIPLIINEFAIGTLCVIDSKPRTLSEAQMNILTILANQASDQIISWKNQRLLEEQQALISEGSRLASLREMAGGLAHEINNPLAIIQAKAAYIEKVSNTDQFKNSMITESAKSISKIVLRISKIINALKKFSSEQSLMNSEQTLLGTLISDVLILCGEKLKNIDILFIMDEACKNILIRGNSVLLSQVFLNLIQNASDAIEHCDERWIKIDATSLDGKTIISIENSGDPIPSEIQQKLFQPFFTTKPVGKGTGLGLSISNGIIRSHNGSITYNASSPHPSFVITLPN